MTPTTILGAEKIARADIEGPLQSRAMMFHEVNFASDDEMTELINTTILGRLVTVAADGTPHIGLFPFVWTMDLVELHLNSQDEQLTDLLAHPKCIFGVDDVMAATPSHWLDRDNAKMATAFHRTIVADCTATISNDPR